MLPTSREDQPRARLTAIGADVEQGPPAPSEDWPRATDGLRGQPTRHGRQRDRGGRGGCCGRRTAAREHGKTSGIELRRSGDRLIRRMWRIHGCCCGRGIASRRAGASPIAPRRPGRAWKGVRKGGAEPMPARRRRSQWLALGLRSLDQKRRSSRRGARRGSLIETAAKGLVYRGQPFRNSGIEIESKNRNRTRGLGTFEATTTIIQNNLPCRQLRSSIHLLPEVPSESESMAGSMDAKS